jgi:ParB-like chromosome segregation protein Spo0J
MFEKADPINNVVWRDASELEPNNWNPNLVFNAEIALLERSILVNGWVEPITISPRFLIINGWHRWRLSTDSEKIRKKYKGKLPTVMVDVPENEAMLMTIRLGRARGTQIAQRMADVVKRLVNDHGYDLQQIAIEIGATQSEVGLLYENDLWKERGIKDHVYSKAWVPHENGKRGKK